MFQGDSTRQKKNFIALDEVIDDDSALLIRFLWKAGLKVPHSVLHSQVWIQRRWDQTSTNFLKEKKKSSGKNHVHSHETAPYNAKTEKDSKSSSM